MVREKRLYANANTLKLAQLLESGSSVAVIDVRSAGEWGGGHIEGALHIPVDELERRLSEVPRDGTPLYLICASGGRSAAAADLLGQRGYLHVHNVEGGMQAWRGAAVQG
ncbi:MAG: rhodanese-like domain-containing protein [Planctomycetota bacterium]|nr:MAG: rhodanese-like domain-containing protein [Planctomycetota bacterium]RKY20687.1 MAG: rhodanese-like domain-containing protein [Planctomycetota bacterium]